MASNVEVIDIDSSEDEQNQNNLSDISQTQDNNKTLPNIVGQTFIIGTSQNKTTTTNHVIENNNHNDEQKPNISLNSNSPNKVSEKRRKKIDDLLDLFEACRTRLSKCEHLMNQEQKNKWTSYQPSIILNLPPQPQYTTYQQQGHAFNNSIPSPSLLDEERDDFFGLRKTDYQYSHTVARRAAPKTTRRRRYRKKRTTTKSSPKKPRATTAKTTYKPPKTTSNVKVKRETKPSTSFRVKKEC